MTHYKLVWLLLMLPPLGVGFLAGLLVAEVAVLLTLSVLGAGVGALTVLTVPQGGHPRGRAPLVHRAMARALAVGAGAATFVSLIYLLEGLVWPTLGAVALTSPPVVTSALRMVRVLSPQLMTDHELCRAWRASTIVLRSAAAHERLALALRRQDYLDEMEHRNADGFVPGWRQGHAPRNNSSASWSPALRRRSEGMLHPR